MKKPTNIFVDKKTGKEWELVGFTKDKIILQDNEVECRLKVKKGLSPQIVFAKNFTKKEDLLLS